MTAAARIGLALASVLLCAAGCASRLPQYPLTDAPTTLAKLKERSALVRSVSGEGRVTLVSADGQSIRLDCAMVLVPPDHMRLRAWKLGQAVMDLTLTPSGLWIVQPSGRGASADMGGLSAERLRRVWGLLGGELFSQPGLELSLDGDQMLVERREPDGAAVTAIVHRPTLTPRAYEYRDTGGRAVLSLQLERYELVQGVAWPHRIEAISDQGTIIVDLHDVELGAEPPPGAFVPPARARQAP